MSSTQVVQLASVVVAVGVALWLSLVAAKSRKGDNYLCDACSFNQPDLCFKPDRPNALHCLSYKKSDEVHAGSGIMGKLPDGDASPQ